MSEETQEAPVDSHSSANLGTSEVGQSNQSEEQGTGANNPAAFQADYTRKYQELAEQRRQFEAERQSFMQQIQGYQQPTQSQGYGAYQPPYQPQNQDPTQVLMDQLGLDSVQALNAKLDSLIAPLKQQLAQNSFRSEYNSQYAQAAKKYGQAFSKYDYVDNTGMLRNKVIDKMCLVDPVTRLSPSLDDAWGLVNYGNEDGVKSLREQIRQDLLEEMKQKKEGTIPSAGVSQPNKNPQPAKARSIRDAYNQIKDEL